MSLKIKLDDDFYLREASVYGIVSELPDYRLCYYLNRDLNLELARSREDHSYLYKGKVLVYSEYRYYHPVYQTHWFVTSNKKPFYEGSDPTERAAIVLVPDQRVYDYFLWCEGEENSAAEQEINTVLKKLPYIRTCGKISIDDSKNINNLLDE